MALDLVNKLSYDHPYRWDGTAVGGVKLWRPDELGADLAVWLDAEDTSTITLNGSNVSQWDDKSGNGRHVSQANATQQPAYTTGALSNKPVLTFDGVNDTLQRASAGLDGLSSVSIFVVMRYITANAEDIPVGVGAAFNAGRIRSLYRKTSGTTQGWANWAKDVNDSAFSCHIGGDYHIFAGWNTSLVASNNIVIARDGLSSVYTNANGNLSTTVDGLGIGELVGSTIRYTNASIAEVVILPVAVTASQQRLIEGYLAHKWGLTDNLPVEHPYKLTPPYAGEPVYDPDAQTYFNRVEGPTGDNQTLEASVKTAINDFVVGCKSDGIWDAIKSSAILAGARTLSGALQPLAGTAPTNFNFVSGDYDRKTGLKGNGSTKYLDSNRNNNADPQNNKHLSAYLTQAQSGTSGIHIGTNTAVTAGTCQIASDLSGNTTNFSVNNTQTAGISSVTPRTGFLGATRSAASDFTARVDGANATALISSDAPHNISTYIFCRNGNAVFSNARLSFYSIGESIDLAALDTRVSALMTALDGAIA